ncbi:hypothetical protein [Marinobacter sp. SS21]|uniref:hypothetical protein n=1 Tax=Marinobacter sp. SS21 TaxID=2979460 RepID=UPI00232B7641|nr:hypothetical protein [Marinobacter sp. SS21]MDC0661764.1 hypothetical protein [Marinobacter sp. SS21]
MAARMGRVLSLISTNFATVPQAMTLAIRRLAQRVVMGDNTIGRYTQSQALDSVSLHNNKLGLVNPDNPSALVFMTVGFHDKGLCSI